MKSAEKLGHGNAAAAVQLRTRLNHARTISCAEADVATEPWNANTAARCLRCCSNPSCEMQPHDDLHHEHPSQGHLRPSPAVMKGEVHTVLSFCNLIDD